jgi:tRNA pseudouridine38-40 synthase
LLEQVVKLFEGKHDFTSFANESHTGSAAKDPVRTLHRLEMVPEPNGIVLAFTGDGFLYKMVRNIVGTLLDVAAGKMSIESIPDIFAALDRRKAGQAAPAHGLFLMQVDYISK